MKVFDFLVIRAADGARAEGNYFFHVLHGAGGIEGRRRSAVGGEREGWKR